MELVSDDTEHEDEAPPTKREGAGKRTDPVALDRGSLVGRYVVRSSRRTPRRTPAKASLQRALAIAAKAKVSDQDLAATRAAVHQLQ